MEEAKPAIHGRDHLLGGADPIVGLSPTRYLVMVFDGASVGLSPGYAGDVQIAFACTIKSWTILADVSGSIQFDIWKDIYANYPPTIADTIVASSHPHLTSQNRNTDNVLSGWTTAITAGDTLRLHVDSVSGLHQVTLHLELEPS